MQILSVLHSIAHIAVANFAKIVRKKFLKQMRFAKTAALNSLS
jgi:hypothetical protein